MHRILCLIAAGIFTATAATAQTTNETAEVIPVDPGSFQEAGPRQDDPRDPKFIAGTTEMPSHYVVFVDPDTTVTDTTFPGNAHWQKVNAGDRFKVGFNISGAQSFVCGSQTGFDVYNVELFVFAPEACTVTVRFDLEEADLSNPNCPAPGPPLCDSGSVTITLPAPGNYILGVPIDCDCETFFADYFYGVTFEAVSCNTGPFVVTSGTSIPCKSYRDTGNGWVDLNTVPGWTGNVHMVGQAVCCDEPVSTDPSTWGRVKGLFEN